MISTRKTPAADQNGAAWSDNGIDQKLQYSYPIIAIPHVSLLFEKCSISVLLCRKKEQMLMINKVWICTTHCSINCETNVGFKLKKKN